jgi:hypothetical protein
MKNRKKIAILLRKLYNDNEYIKLGIYHFKIVKSCTYFGKILTNKNELTPENEKGITNAKRQYYALEPALKSQSVLTDSRKKNKNLRPAMTYRAESWTLNKDIVKRLVTFERKPLRRMGDRN